MSWTFAGFYRQEHDGWGSEVPPSEQGASASSESWNLPEHEEERHHFYEPRLVLFGYDRLCFLQTFATEVTVRDIACR